MLQTGTLAYVVSNEASASTSYHAIRMIRSILTGRPWKNQGAKEYLHNYRTSRIETSYLPTQEQQQRWWPSASWLRLLRILIKNMNMEKSRLHEKCHERRVVQPMTVRGQLDGRATMRDGVVIRKCYPFCKPFCKPTRARDLAFIFAIYSHF